MNYRLTKSQLGTAGRKWAELIVKVVKFGGSSLANGPQVAKAVEIMRADPRRRVMVVSAPGKRFGGDAKVTDLLGELAAAILAGQDTASLLGQILGRYRSIADYFDLAGETIADHFRTHLRTLQESDYPNSEYLLAAFLAQGEWMNAHLIAAVLQHEGLPARWVSPQDLGMVIAGPPRLAQLLPDSYDRLANFSLPADEILVVPGFFAYDAQGHIATFARGGSDITGSILARGLHADLYENFTDVSAIYAADPQIIAHPRAINTLTYREMRELSCAGFSVFNDEAIVPAIQGDVRINVKNTNDPEAPGTLIAPTKEVNHHHLITGIAASNGHIALYIHRYLLNREVRFPLQILQVLAKYHVSYEQMPAGVDDLTIIFSQKQVIPAVQTAMTREIRAAVQPDVLRWIPNLAMVVVVGEGLAHRTDLVAQILTQLATVEIAPVIISQGAARINLTMGVDTTQAAAAIQALYALSAEDYNNAQ